jgi:hypothetical protein
MMQSSNPVPHASQTTALAKLAALKRLSITDLKERWRSLMGSEAPNNSRSYLEHRLGYRIQELERGGLDKRVAKLLDAMADEIEGKPVRVAMILDSRTPVAGTRLVREWNGTEHTVTVMRDGFEWQGRTYKSLSAIARSVTGTRWNGYRFFGLRESRRGGR